MWKSSNAVSAFRQTNGWTRARVNVETRRAPRANPEVKIPVKGSLTALCTGQSMSILCWNQFADRHSLSFPSFAGFSLLQRSLPGSYSSFQGTCAFERLENRLKRRKDCIDIFVPDVSLEIIYMPSTDVYFTWIFITQSSTDLQISSYIFEASVRALSATNFHGTFAILQVLKVIRKCRRIEGNELKNRRH